jgi:hypothetical protein
MIRTPTINTLFIIGVPVGEWPSGGSIAVERPDLCECNICGRALWHSKLIEYRNKYVDNVVFCPACFDARCCAADDP